MGTVRPGASSRTETASADSLAIERLRHLSAITEAALAHLTLDELMETLLTRLRDILRVDTVAVLLIDEEHGELVARAASGLEGEVEQGARIPVGHGFAGRVAADRKPVFVPDVREADVVNPILGEKGIASLLGVPLMVEGEVTGVLHVGSLAPRAFSAYDAELLQLAGDRMALAIEHARLYEAERAAREAAEASAEQLRQLQSITEATLAHVSLDDALLVGMLDRVREVLDVDTAAILLLDPRGNELVARAARGLEQEVERGVRIPVGGGFAGRIAEERRPVIVEDLLEDETVLNPILREKGVRSLLGVPLLVESRVLGVLHAGTLQPRSFTPEEVRLLELTADRIALAIDRGRQRNVAELLQRSLLPVRLPSVAGFSMAARYQASADDAHVGGDWYDVIPVAEGRIGLAMGDVVSRGVRAAAVMGQMRTALRAYALDGGSPASVMRRLDRLVHSIEDRDMATVAYVVLDPDTGDVRYALAGHPAPLVVSADGTSARFLEDTRSRPIGVASPGPFEEAKARLEPGETLLLYTDGLLERRDAGIDEGLERLASVVADRRRDPEDLCEHLLREFKPGADDVAVLAVQRGTTADLGKLHLELTATAHSLSGMRHALRSWLRRAGLSEDAAYDVLVATSEAAANAVEHAYGPEDALFEVRAEAEESEVVVSVIDNGSWRSPRGEHRGRGLEVMRELMDQIDVVPGETGTVVRMRKAIGEVMAT